ncbi:hypothetical protein EJ03DRAFT_327995 [Teratosphaeria nubilosa]|uniref:Uncharacterized protein n=1 Tax=Teratosphaeria nubilosa TaxID=161662 RepID=A0A6G1L8D9_9PEZI|nr:hypothetical protein EJ03DRAFT_327995 [Teratosphaeria nubilosa]
MSPSSMTQTLLLLTRPRSPAQTDSQRLLHFLLHNQPLIIQLLPLAAVLLNLLMVPLLPLVGALNDREWAQYEVEAEGCAGEVIGGAGVFLGFGFLARLGAGF